MPGTRIDEILTMARWKRLLRPRDLSARQISREHLRRACEQGLIERVGRGLYQLPGAPLSENRSLIEVCCRSPSGVICLLSALRFHNLTTQNPPDVWLALESSAYVPRIDTISLRVVRFSGDSLTAGIQKTTTTSGRVRVYSAAKTVADCFKCRGKIGVDVAIEALRDCLQQRKASVSDIVHYARICRVERIMSPYLEAML